MRLLLLNLMRKPLRTLLTVFGVGVALFLFCFLETVLMSFNAGVNMSDASRLVVQHKESIIFELPMSYRSLIEQTEGVTGVSSASWFGALSQEPGPDGAKFRSGAALPEPEGEVIIIHLCRDVGLHREAMIPQGEVEIQVIVG